MGYSLCCMTCVFVHLMVIHSKMIALFHYFVHPFTLPKPFLTMFAVGVTCMNSNSLTASSKTSALGLSIMVCTSMPTYTFKNI